MLVSSRQGYENACRLLTRAHLAGEAERVGVARGGSREVNGVGEVVEAGELSGLVCLTGDGDGALSRMLAAGEHAGAEEWVQGLVRRFGLGNVYVELVRHRRRGEERMNRLRAELAEHLRLPMVAANAPLAAERGGRPLVDAFACLRHHTDVDHAGLLLEGNSERHLKGAKEMAELFRDFPGAVARTAELAERLEFSLDKVGYEFPSFRDPSTCRALARDEEARLLRELAFRGARERCGGLPVAIARQLDVELELIGRLGFCGYFLVVHGIKEFARSRGILCQGRGSAANSVVCYALGITNVDPLKHHLLFSRFLSENRKSWPDIDLDLPSGAPREEVIRHVYESYAPHGAAMTANVICYRPRSAFREMAKVLGFGAEVADRFSELAAAPRVEDHGAAAQAGAAAMGDFYPGSRVEELSATMARAGVPEDHPRGRALRGLYAQVLGLPRHLGQHPGGMVLCQGRLDHVVPLQPSAMPGRVIVQWDKDDCEDMGMVKVDLLGLGMLAAMGEMIEVCGRRGRPVDLGQLPLDDEPTFNLMCRADTVGTFQVESRAQMATLPVMQPRTFYDVAVEVAIIRPGPVVGDLVHPYLNRRNGREAVDCIHPLFEPILRRTLGVPLFQEQILEMAMVVAGFSGAEADELRRAMSFKRDDKRLHRAVARLDQAMAARGLARTVRDKVAHAMQSFALYGFPESHAISFALIAYASCWFKVHHPAVFYAALLNHQPMGFYSPATLVADARRHSVRVRPVCVVHSGAGTEVTGAREIRLGLNRLKGMSKRATQALLKARSESPFSSLHDFFQRVRPAAGERRRLAATGALNTLEHGMHRREALWQAELPLEEGLFADAAPAPDPETGPALAPMDPFERLAADYSHAGVTTGPHPMALLRAAETPGGYGASRQRENPAHLPRAADLPRCRAGRAVAVVGMVICRQRPGTAKGHCFISLEDETGVINLFVPRDTYRRYRYLIASETFLIARGTLQHGEGGTVSVLVRELEPLCQANDGAKEPAHAPSHDFH